MSGPAPISVDGRLESTGVLGQLLKLHTYATKVKHVSSDEGPRPDAVSAV